MNKTLKVFVVTPIVPAIFFPASEEVNDDSLIKAIYIWFFFAITVSYALFGMIVFPLYLIAKNKINNKNFICALSSLISGVVIIIVSILFGASEVDEYFIAGVFGIGIGYVTGFFFGE